VVDVGDDGDISNGLAHGRGIPILPGRGKALVEIDYPCFELAGYDRQDNRVMPYL
jgi:hypothetical protein